VEQICAEAGVARSTFYTHFADKDDLKRHGLDSLGAALRAHRAQSGGAPFRFCEALFRHAQTHHEHLCALAGGRGETVSRAQLMALLTEVVCEDLISLGTRADLRPRAAMAVGALMALFDEWLADGARRAPEEMAALFRTVAQEGFAPP